MVNYLASHAQRKIKSRLNVSDNPCPTCRQNYCTVNDEDILLVVKQKLSSLVPKKSSSII